MNRFTHARVAAARLWLGSLAVGLIIAIVAAGGIFAGVTLTHLATLSKENSALIRHNAVRQRQTDSLIHEQNETLHDIHSLLTFVARVESGKTPLNPPNETFVKYLAALCAATHASCTGV